MLACVMWMVLVQAAHAGTTFIKTYSAPRLQYGSEDIANVVLSCPDGGYFIAGSTEQADYESMKDVHYFRITQNGGVLWEENFEETGDNVVRAAALTHEGGFVLAGETYQNKSITSDAFILKIDAKGQQDWKKTFGRIGNDSIASIKTLPNGGYVVAGYSEAPGKGARDAYVARFDATGSPLWEEYLGGEAADEGRAAAVLPDGRIIVAGSTQSKGMGQDDVALWALDAEGKLLWHQTYGWQGSDRAYALAMASDGGYWVSGLTRSRGAGASDVYVLRLDATGGLLWQQTYGDEGTDEAIALEVAPDGGAFIVGTSQPLSFEKTDVYVLRLDREGKELWNRHIGGPREDVANGAALTPDGGLVIAGSTKSFGDLLGDFYLIKTDDQGQVSGSEGKPSGF